MHTQTFAACTLFANSFTSCMKIQLLRTSVVAMLCMDCGLAQYCTAESCYCITVANSHKYMLLCLN